MRITSVAIWVAFTGFVAGCGDDGGGGGGYATTPPYSSMTTSGNSFACRLYHAAVASGTPNVHCPHTAAISTTCQP